MKVTLERHKGMMSTALGVVEVEHDQYLVFAQLGDDTPRVHIGYVGTHDNAPFNGLDAFSRLPAAMRSQIVSALDAAPELKGTHDANFVSVEVLDMVETMAAADEEEADEE